MSLRKQTWLLFGIVFGSLALFSYYLSEYILLKNYQELEKQFVENSTQRVMNTIRSDIDQLSLISADWAFWDDTYRYAQHQYGDYVTANLSNDSLANLNLNLVLILDKNGEVLFSKGLDYATGQDESIPTDLLGYFEPGSALLSQVTSESSLVEGILPSSKAPVMISMRPILTSHEEGPIQGYLIFGRYLDDAAVQSLSERLQTPLEILHYSPSQLTASQRAAADSLATGQNVVVAPVDSETIAGYGRMDDLMEQPALLIQVSLLRAIFLQGRRSVITYLIIIAAIGLGIALITAYLLEKKVLERLRILHESMVNIQATQDLNTGIPVQGSDELAVLASGIRTMLAELAHSRRELEQANHLLEERVAQRTTDLEQANRLLTEEVAERKLAQAELAQARDQAMDALRLKAQILANISHDARTPLNVIMLQADILRAQVYGPLNGQQRELLVSIRDSTRQLTEFMNSLLEESQASAGRMTLHKEPFEPGEFLEQVCNTLKPLAERKCLELRTLLEPGVPKTILGDQLRLEQILNNLVGNAIKFTDTGYIEASIRLPDAEHWAIQVEDSGVGVAPENRERIFDPFWQVDGSISRKETRGVGLGLSIVRQLTTIMKGAIQVSDNPNAEHGSRFIVVLPLNSSEASERRLPG
jgi:signal transduction histidine kinase